MSRINWTQVLVFGSVVLIFIVVGLSLLPALLGGGYWGMGPGMMGRGGMMRGWCPWCAGTARFARGGLIGGAFGLLFVLPGLLIPIGLLGLLILGGVWLVRNIGSTTTVVPPSLACRHCGRLAQADWQHCPYCGEKL